MFEDKECEPLLTFVVGNQRFALPIERVKDVMYTPFLTPIPLTTKEIGGLLNLRGYIVTAICFDAFFDLETKHMDEKKMCIVLQGDDDEMYSFIVDKVFDIHEVQKSEWESLPGSLHVQWSDYTQGILKTHEHLILILNPDAILRKLKGVLML